MENEIKGSIGFIEVGFFEESPGVKSSSRLYAFIILVVWLLILAYQVIAGGGFSGFEYHILLVTAIFAPKTISKFAELKSDGFSKVPEIKDTSNV